MTNRLETVDRIALVAAKAAFERWCSQRTHTLCEEYVELFHQKRDEVDIALRQIRRCPQLYAENDVQFWQQRDAEITKRLEMIVYEIGVMLFEYFLPMRLRRWRAARPKNGGGGGARIQL